MVVLKSYKKKLHIFFPLLANTQLASHPSPLAKLDFLHVESHFLLEHMMAATYTLFEEDGVSCLYVDTPQVSMSSNPPYSAAYGIELLHLMHFTYG